MGRVVKDRYELTEEIGEGAISTLWRGLLRADAGFSRQVAVRQLASRYAKDPRFVGAWSAAASELAVVAGPNVEQVLDLVVDGERVYVITEWVEGLSLRGWLGAAEGPIDWPLATRVAIGLLHGLARPHDREPPLLHGGVTSRAVRVSDDGTVKLMRYGAPAALAASGAGRRTMEEEGLWHRAPELAADAAATAVTDQLAVGAVLYELLAAEPAYADAEAVERGEFGDLATRRDDVPPLLVAHVERALRPAPGERFESAEAMARALEQLVRTSSGQGDRASLARAVRDLRAHVGDDASRTQVAGPAALAASLRSMSSNPPPLDETPPEKRPKGLPVERTMAVSVRELQDIPVGQTLPPDAPEEEAASQDDEDDEEGKKRYRFTPKERSATKKVEEEKSAVLGIPPQDSEAAPLLLTKSKRPVGLSPQRTEFLDEDQVDHLTIGRTPAGLKPAQTEMLGESEVDRLTLENIPGAKKKAKKKKRKKKRKKGAPLPKKPLGLLPQKTEFLPEGEVDDLEIKD